MSNDKGSWRSTVAVWAAIALSIACLAAATFSAASGGLRYGGKERWQVLAPVHYQNLHIFPIIWLPGLAAPDVSDYITLDEGLKQGTVEVTEVGAPGQIIRNRPPSGGVMGHFQNGVEQVAANPPAQGRAEPVQQRQTVGQTGAQVNRLFVTNKSGKKLILLAGELVVGGKQDRIVQKDTLVPPGQKPFDLSVFCVEQGRWHGDNVAFGAAQNAAVAGGLGAVADPSVRGAAQAERKQEVVWARVGEKNAQAGAAPPSGTYLGTLQSDKAQKDAKPYFDAIQPRMPRNAVGAVIAIHGRLVWVDAFAHPDLFQRYWPKLLQSYIVEALTSPPPREPADERIPRVLRSPPTIAEAAKFLFDRSGRETFEGEAGVYRLTRIDGQQHVMFELHDLDPKDPVRVHFNKMKKR